MSRLEKRSLELYKGLSPKQKGVLAFELSIAGNEAEEGKLKGTVERHTYRQLDVDVVDWRQYLFTVGQCLAADFWKFYALTLAAMLYARIADELERPSVIETLKTVEHYEMQKIGIYEATRRFCEEHGVDFEAIKKIGGIDGVENFIFKGQPDEKVVNEFLDIFRRNAPK